MDLLHLVGTFPTVIYTGLLALSLVYWLFVILGAIDVDALGGAHDGAIDGAVDGVVGAGKGGIEGLAGAGKGAVEGVVGAAKGAAHQADIAIDGETAAAGILSFLRLRSAPVTVVVSLFALFGWLLSTLTVQSLGVPGLLGGLGLFFGSAILSLVLTSVAIRPVAPFFATKAGRKSTSLVGKIAVVSTGEVTKRFGQATFEGEGLSATIQVRSDETAPLSRGDKVVLVAWDERAHVFYVEKLPSADDVLLHREALREAEAEVEAALAEGASKDAKKRGEAGPT
ncbi:MAG: DUF1449 family protein [Myxococcales bacterium]|nr:DUF1449 family protein [Myxococcales bacterium]